MKTIQVAEYELIANRPLNAASSTSKRKGALLKIQFPDLKIGYADCHPWQELGDLSLQDQLDHLVQGKFTSLTQCACIFARLDAEARSNNRSLFPRPFLLKSHFLIIHIFDWTRSKIQQLIDLGYTHVKVKMGRNLQQEIEALHQLLTDFPLKIRLDFNETLTLHAFKDFLRGIATLYPQIDFIEDPFPFDAHEWSAFQKNGWALACDRQAHAAWNCADAARFLVIKPAIQTHHLWETKTDQSCIFTSYLGHPFEQITAAYIASQSDPSGKYVHGLLSHHAYLPNSFSRHLNWMNSQFILPSGMGFGFDQELEKLDWRILS